MAGTAPQKPPEQAPAPSDDAGSPPGQQQGGASAAGSPQDASADVAAAAAAAAASDEVAEPAVKAEPGAAEEEEARRADRRDKRECEAEAAQRWELQRRLADISADVEWLAREVERVRSEVEVPLPPLSTLPEGERAALEAARRKRCADLLQHHCKKALGHITTHKWSWPFNSPVDLRQYPDYAEMVKRPMDFGTVKRCVDGGAYRHPDDFLADVRLVFDNARLYNKPGSDVHVMANTLQERFEDRYAASVAPRVAEEAALYRHQQEEARQRHVQAGGGGGGGRSAGASGGGVMAQHCSVLVRYIDEVVACVLDARSSAAALCAPVPRHDKEALVRSLAALPQGQFELAVGLVMQHHPGLQPYDDFGFDLDALDALALRQMQSFVRACEAANAEAEEEQGGGAAAVAWPQLLLGAGLRPYRVPPSKRPKRPPTAGHRQRAQQQPQVKQEQQDDAATGQQAAQPPAEQPQSPPAGQRPQQLAAGQQQLAEAGRQLLKRPLAEVVGDTAAPAPTPETAAAGMVSPALPPIVPAVAGSAVGPKPLAAEALPQQQAQQPKQPKQQQQQKRPRVSPPVQAAAAAAKPAGGASANAAAGGPPVTSTQLAQMQSMLTQALAVQAAAAAAKAKPARQPSPKGGK